jgi:hypothetical protein
VTKLEHYHCPHECEHPQPFVAEDGRRLCGRCWVRDDVKREMILCTPETCPKDFVATRPASTKVRSARDG